MAENAGWDAEMLRVELEELTEAGVDLDGIGFDEESLDELIGGLDEPHTEGDTEPEEPPATPVSRRGDVWTLGKHRLMCGDSTSAEDVAKLMNGEKAEICFTSPPYNVTIKIKNPKYGNKYGNYSENTDDKSPEEYTQFLQRYLDNALAYCDDAFVNIGYIAAGNEGCAQWIGNNARRFAGAIHWIKNTCITPQFDSQHGILANISEPIYIFNDRRERKVLHPQWQIGGRMTNTINYACAQDNEYREQHSAVFPVELAEHFCRNFCGESILDLFCGTGTTIIAAENTGRKAYGMELAPAYVDVSIKRWQQHTGQQATLDGKTFDEIAAERAQ